MRLGRALIGVLLALPLVAVAQSRALAPAHDAPTPVEQRASVADFSAEGEWMLPLWRSADGRWLALALTPEATTDDDRLPNPAPRLHLVDATSLVSSGMRWSLAPNFFARAGVQQRVLAPGSICDATSIDADCRQSPSWSGGEFGGGYLADGFRLDVGVNWLQHNEVGDSQAALLAPTAYAMPGMLGMRPELVDSLSGVNARGSMRIGASDTSVSLGAGIGRVNLIPGGNLDLDAIDQKSLSLGVGTGPISGLVVGRIMEPSSPLNPLGSTASWRALDLGITLRLPWDGELSVGAQNVWSSGAAPLSNAAEADPSQRRVPYIQYHQEL